MAEFESLAGDEALEAHLARHALDRLVMLSDGVFAIATTLAALEIRLPEGVRDPLAALRAMGRPLFAYAVSFMVIAIFWISHRDLFARLERVNRTVTLLTLLLLFGISLIPLGVSGIAEHGANAGFRVYAATMLATGLINAALWCYASFTPGVMRTAVPAEYRWTRALGSWAMPAMFVPLAMAGLEQMEYTLLATVVVVAMVRRVVLPAFLRRKFVGKTAAPGIESAAIPTP